MAVQAAAQGTLTKASVHISTDQLFRTWNFGGLTATGGAAGAIKNAPVTGGSF